MGSQAPRAGFRRLMAAGAAAAAIGLGTAIFALTHGAPATPPHASPSPASAPGWTIASDNPAIEVAALAALPSAPGAGPIDGYCLDYVRAPRTPQARAAAAKGWKIAAEGRLGPLVAVMIVSGYDPATSGYCGARDGTVALFDGDRLVAVAYSPKDARIGIGSFEAQGAGLRLGTDIPLAPVGDLVVQGHAIRVEPLPPADTACAGRRRVPNIYGLAIAAARRKLAAAGWKPIPSREPVEYFAADLRARGIVEVVSCVPTGFGQCAFDYAAGRDRLTVTTTGDSPEEVTLYSIACH